MKFWLCTFCGFVFCICSFASPKVIHVFVALCDNKNQGIVPVPEQLGNGDDPNNNLYWGALYGVKTYFNKSKDWKLIQTTTDFNDNILVRVVFKNNIKDVFLIADAYRGSKIKIAIIDFLSASGGKELNTDLVVYIGHNGLMDFTIDKTSLFLDKKSNAHPSSIVLACKSSQYFSGFLDTQKSDSLLLTTGFMAPEAYTLEAALNAYLANEDKTKIKEKAAQAYNKYQKCGMPAARNLFK